LSRRLADEGKPSAEVLNEAQVLVAKHLLRDERRTIQQVAEAMGFSDASTFHRAFKRWTGMTPSGYREAGRK
jgi:AraC-like DNA-binding protein